MTEDTNHREGPSLVRTGGPGRLATGYRVESDLTSLIQSPPASVAIVAMGESSTTYVKLASQAGDRHRIAEETWVVNSMGGVIQHDRVFQMDDLRLQERRALSMPESSVSGTMDWLRDHPGPIYTSTPYPEYPGSVEFPLEQVVNDVGLLYMNSTVAYAVGMAIMLRIPHVQLYGCDFSYKDTHVAEKGRACVEFLLGIAGVRGINITVAAESTLMDANVDEEEKVYGYEAWNVAIERGDDGRIKIIKTPRERMPTVQAQNKLYDHRQPGYEPPENAEFGTDLSAMPRLDEYKKPKTKEEQPDGTEALRPNQASITEA